MLTEVRASTVVTSHLTSSLKPKARQSSSRSLSSFLRTRKSRSQTILPRSRRRLRLAGRCQSLLRTSAARPFLRASSTNVACSAEFALSRYPALMTAAKNPRRFDHFHRLYYAHGASSTSRSSEIRSVFNEPTMSTARESSKSVLLNSLMVLLPSSLVDPVKSRSARRRTAAMTR